MSNILRSCKRSMIESAKKQKMKCCGGKTMQKMAEEVYNPQTKENEYIPILVCPTCGKKIRMSIEEVKRNERKKHH